MLPRVALTLLLLGVHLFAREEFTRTFQKTVTLPAAQRIEVDNRFGDVLVRAQPGGNVAISAAIKATAGDLAEAKRIAERIVIDVQQSASALTIRTRYPDEPHGFPFGRRHVSFSVSYDILLPETSPLRVRNSFGGVVVTDVKADAAITNSNGKLIFRDGRGAHHLENSFGPLEVEGNSGDVWIVNANGPVRATNITGSVDLRNQFGEVLVRRVSGTVKIANANGSVDLSGAGGPANITNSFGSVTASGLKGNLTVRNPNGDITATGIAGDADLNTTFGAVKFFDIGKRLTVQAANSGISGSKVGEGATIGTSFGPVDLRDVSGSVNVRNANAAVTVQSAAGPVEVRDSFGAVDVRGVRKGARVVSANGDITLADVGEEAYAKTSFGQVRAERVGGPVTVENANGAVVVSGVPAKPCSPVALTTSFSHLKLYLTEGAGYNLTAKTSFGKIHSELDVAASGTVTADALAGRIGGGGCELRLTNSNGGIEILKAVNLARK